MSRWLCVLLVLMTAGSASAREISAGVRTSLIFTNNLFSTPEGKEGGMVLQVVPYASNSYNSSRSSYQWFYGPSAIIYGGGKSDLNRLGHNLQLSANVALYKEYLGLNISARAAQNLISPNRSGRGGGFDSIGNPDNYAQTFAFGITPVFNVPLTFNGDFATVKIAPGINFAFTADTASGRQNVGSRGSASSVTVTSGEMFSRMPWSLRWSSNVWTSGQNRYNQFSFNTSYRVNSELSVGGTLGFDSSFFDGSQTGRDPRWRITPRWTPTSNTSIAIGYGHRFSGNDWYLSIQRSFKRSTLDLRYETTISDARTALLDQDVVAFQDPFGNPIDPATTQDFTGINTTPALVNDTYVQNRLSATYAWTRGRNNVTFSLRQDDRSYQVSNVSTLDLYSTIGYSRSLTSRAQGSATLNIWAHDDRQVTLASENDFTEYRLNLAYGYSLGARTSTSVTYSFINRQSGSQGYDFGENRLYLTLNYQL